MTDEYSKLTKKKGGFWKRFFINICLGIVFGFCAGITFISIALVYEIMPVKELLIAGGVIEDPNPIEPQLTLCFGDTGVAVMENNRLAIGEEALSGEPMEIKEVVKQTMPAIVSVNLTADYHAHGMVQEVSSAGSGIIVGQNETELLIVTNYHVVEGGKEIKVQFCDGTEGTATVKGQDIPMDIAVMAVNLEELSEETKNNIKTIQLGDSDALEVGETAIAIGNSLGYGQSVTTGVISALNREMTLENGEKGTFIQTDAAINQGNSGGALLNDRGELIGINSNKLGGTYVEGMGYAIPINMAEPIIDQLMNKEELVALPEEQQSYLGISGTTLTSSLASQQAIRPPVGIYVAGVVKDGPAQKAGIMRGDVITKFEGNSIATMEELQEYLAAYPAGTTITLTYERLEDGEYVEYECKVLLEKKES